VPSCDTVKKNLINFNLSDAETVSEFSYPIVPGNGRYQWYHEESCLHGTCLWKNGKWWVGFVGEVLMLCDREEENEGQRNDSLCAAPRVPPCELRTHVVGRLCQRGTSTLRM
jgi:hypothetical protein